MTEPPPGRRGPPAPPNTQSVGNLPTELRYEANIPLPSSRVTDRRMWYVKPRDTLRCYPGAIGHKIPDGDIASCKGPVRCHAKHQPKPIAGAPYPRGVRHGDECGAMLYVIWMPGGLRFVAQITRQELTYMQNVGMSEIGDVLEFLGATNPMRAA